MKKARLSVYLDHQVMEALSEFAARRRQSLSLIAEAAISSFVSPEQSTDALNRRLGKLERHLQKMERNSLITSEALMVYVWYWLLATPALPVHSEDAVRASATERYDTFMETLGQRLAKAASQLP
jgi:predicted transcriptional regulator